mmetsp:Transcript_27372/g.61412  ORF Transcript_27372/g.61412 Transcript_27372/m.61412 type:complete len:246 (+) Transcript_27372:186-923(+)
MFSLAPSLFILVHPFVGTLSSGPAFPLGPFLWLLLLLLRGSRTVLHVLLWKMGRGERCSDGILVNRSVNLGTRVALVGNAERAERSPGQIVQFFVLDKQLLDLLLELVNPPRLELTTLDFVELKNLKQVQLVRGKEYESLVTRRVIHLGLPHPVDIINWVHRRLVLDNVVDVGRYLKLPEGNVRCEHNPGVVIDERVVRADDIVVVLLEVLVHGYDVGHLELSEKRRVEGGGLPCGADYDDLPLG